MKICFTSSSGGHFEQLIMLQPIMEEHESIILTEKTDYFDYTQMNIPIFFLRQTNRKELRFLLHFISNSYKSIKVFVKFRPDVIISTGALSTIPVCIISKLFRKKVIFIESFSKTESGTMTGKFMYKIADKFYVQWSSMKKIYPNAEFKGSLY